MASKVIHVSDYHHAMAKEYCTKRKLRMTEWIGEIIEMHTKRHYSESELVAVGGDNLENKKTLPKIEESDTEGGFDPSAPPFWENRQQ